MSQGSHPPPVVSAREEGSFRTGDARFSVARVMRLAQKELRETLRDRRTIITLVLMPLLVYPVLSVALKQFLVSSTIQASVFPVGGLGWMEIWILEMPASPTCA